MGADYTEYTPGKFALNVNIAGGGVVPSAASNTVVTEEALDQLDNAGASTTYSRGDHTHGTMPNSLFVTGELKPNFTTFVMPGWFIRSVNVAVGFGNGTIVYVPMFVSETFTYTEIDVDVDTAGTGTTLDTRLFAWNDGVPGAQIASLGSFNVTTNGVKSMAINITLNRGLYFMAFRFNGTTTMKGVDTSQGLTCPVEGLGIGNPFSNLTDFADGTALSVISVYTDPAPAPSTVFTVPIAFLMKRHA